MSCFLPSTTGFFLQDFLQESFLTWVRFHRTLLEKACPEDNLVRSCPRWPADWISLWVTGSFHSRSRISQWYLSPVQHFGFQLSQTHDRCNLPLHMPVQLSVPCLRKCKSRVTAEPREGDHAWENSCSAERHTRGFWWKPGSGSQEKCYSGLKTALLGRAQDQQLKYKKFHLRGRLEKPSATPLQRKWETAYQHPQHRNKHFCVSCKNYHLHLSVKVCTTHSLHHFHLKHFNVSITTQFSLTCKPLHKVSGRKTSLINMIFLAP